MTIDEMDIEIQRLQRRTDLTADEYRDELHNIVIRYAFPAIKESER